MARLQETVIQLNQFDVDRLHFSPPKIQDFGNIKPCMSQASYELSDGSRVAPLLVLPQQGSAGFFRKGGEGGDRLNGVSVNVRISAGATPATSDEKLAANVFDKIHEKAWAFIKEQALDASSDLPPKARRDIKGGEMDEALKPTLAHPPFKKDPKTGIASQPGLDTSRARQMYMKVDGYSPKDGGDWIPKADVRGAGGRKLDVKRIEGPGDLQPVVLIRGLFIGSHGDNTTYSASVQFRLKQANFNKTESSIPFALAPLPADDKGSESDGSDDESFGDDGHNSDEFTSPTIASAGARDSLRAMAEAGDGDESEDEGAGAGASAAAPKKGDDSAPRRRRRAR
jgi:hypothetical protein